MIKPKILDFADLPEAGVVFVGNALSSSEIESIARSLRDMPRGIRYIVPVTDLDNPLVIAPERELNRAGWYRKEVIDER